ncbi:hypothetical protein [Bifidobacterium cuniculi]|uniref:Putative lipoprotein n=1 Tax=Bifidobacterium cuniculi TaxID=1688 RepID=A0A087AYM1_9BIFI|nr:hypothetical protein [Bifidobacterium cuniculi]KFI63871.1 putative lipoprotein [Bifidobacterium cuniculi]
MTTAIRTPRTSALASAALATILALGGCSTHTAKSYTYNVDTGDAIKIELDTTGGYDIDDEVPFTVTKDGETVTQGTFLKGDEGYSLYSQQVADDEDAEVIAEGEQGGNEYLFWSVDNDGTMEYDYVIRVKDSSTAVLLGSQAGEQEARDVFERMRITVD